MLGLVALGITTAATAGGFVGARRFVRDRLRYVDAIHRTSAPVIAGVGAAVLSGIVITPVGWLLHVGAGTAVLVGLAVGAGTARGARDVREGESVGRLYGE